MNYARALGAMAAGRKVKLSDWMGYWYQEGDQIKVFTRTGDILDTPNIDRYKDRDDWEVTDGALGFEFAILALKNGKMVARSEWKVQHGSPRFLYMVQGTVVEFENLRGAARDAAVLASEWECGVQGSARRINSHIDAVDQYGCLSIGWSPSQDDMLADDWKLV
jgi:allophanate hydrolase subunit 2